MTSPENKFAELNTLLKKKTSRKNHSDELSVEKPKISTLKTTPSIPDAKLEADEQKISSFWKALRAFYRNAQGGGIRGRGLHPALLQSYIDLRHVRYDYPVWIADENMVSEDTPEVRSLTDLLSQAVGDIAPAPQDAKILKDNIGRLELIVRESMDADAVSIPFTEILWPALAKLESQLNIKGQEEKTFSEDLKKFKNSLPASGKLAAYTHETPFLLLAAAVRKQFHRSYRQIKEEAGHLKSKLEELLRVECQKRPDATAPDKLKDVYGYGASFINFEKFSNVIPEASTEMMPPERLARIERTAAILGKADTYFTHDCISVIAENINGKVIGDWSQIFTRSNIQVADKRIVCSEAQNAFESHMRSMAELIGALRIARLEISERYRDEIHNAYFAGFDWRSFTMEEMMLCPPVLLIASADELMQHGLTDFSRLLSSHKPIKTVAVKSNVQITHHAEPTSQTPFSFPQELGAMAITHRNAYVFQSTSIHPDSLYEGLIKGISSFSPALFYILSPKGDAVISGYAWAGSALESRAFPEFTYDQRRGVQWGSRFNVEKNPQASKDWPEYELNFADAHGQSMTMILPFTFADFASQDSFFAEHFLDVPAQFWSDDLVLYSDYLKMEPTEAYTKIPFIWMVDRENQLHKVAVTHFLVLYGQERLDFWHFIQEFGGINSYHVERAIEKVRQEMLDEKQKELAVLNDAHQSEIEQVRQSTAREAMEKLSSILLELDTVEIKPTERKAAPVVTNEAVAQKAVEPEVPKVVEEEAAISTDPWLDTIRCTSCNECINVNPNLFKYNGSKQAYIADAKAGTYAQLVKAAEKCPAKCIHPGMPLNADESGLDELVKRAAAFN